MNPTIAQEFHVPSLLRFAAPTIVMMIFMSLYTIVDGIFISRYVGTDALSATNIVYPVVNILLAVAIMLASGASAVIAYKLGAGKQEEARENLSLIVLTGVLAGLLIGACGLVFMGPLVRMLGADSLLMGYCTDYLGTLLLFAPAAVLQMLFQTFFVTAGKPNLGLLLTIAAGLANALLDYLFIVPLHLGVRGAALATGIGYCIPAVYGVIYFFRKQGILFFARPKLQWGMLLESCFNGSSEMVTNLSTGIITFLFNILMLRYLGEDGVAAITIVLYAQFLLLALYLGFSMGVAPVISYNHGSENFAQLKRIFRICLAFILLSSVGIFLLSILLATRIVGVFSPEGTAVYDLALHGFLLFSISYLFAGVNIFSSSLFTALSNGKVSAIISFLRTFVFIVLGIFLLPQLLKVDGIWLAVPFAELLTALIAGGFLYKGARLYHYN